jgi:hypothetical protein
MKTPVQRAIEQFELLADDEFIEASDDTANALIEECPASMRHGLRLLWSANKSYTRIQR